MNVDPGYFQRKVEEKWNQKTPLAVWFPRLFVVFTQQLEILVTALNNTKSILVFTIGHGHDKTNPSLTGQRKKIPASTNQNILPLINMSKIINWTLEYQEEDSKVHVKF